MLRTFWEVVKDLQETELLVFQTLGRINNLLKANPVLENSNADTVMDLFATVITTSEAFCARMSARITLTPEQSIIFGEDDIVDGHHLCFRLLMTADLPSVEDRLRILWAVSPIQNARTHFQIWISTLSRHNRTLKASLETLAAAVNGIENEARGTKRKAQEDIQTIQ